LLSLKGGGIHRITGKLFLMIIAVVIFTGLVGVSIFGRNTFLLVITALSGYVSFSGYRTLKVKSNKPVTLDLDIVVALLTLVVLAYFLYYFRSNWYDLVTDNHLQYSGCLALDSHL
jgi:hypothetical protein